MPSISGSVGQGGKNDRPDVVEVQQLLTQCGVDPGKVDGDCGPRTIGAIKRFQSRFLARPDGLIEPNGVTWRRLVIGTEWGGDSSQWPLEKKLRSLDVAFRPKISAILEQLGTRGFQPKIFYAWRSVEVQQELFDKGVTKVRFSFHNAQKPDGTPNAYAADLVDARWGWEQAAEDNGFWKALGDEAKRLGLVWGGDWTTFRDVAHVQSRENSELEQVKRESGL